MGFTKNKRRYRIELPEPLGESFEKKFNKNSLGCSDFSDYIQYILKKHLEEESKKGN